MSQFRTWLLERFIQDKDFGDSLSRGEVPSSLAIKLRLLGMKVGQRTQMDNIYAVDHELIEVGDSALFGDAVMRMKGR